MMGKEWNLQIPLLLASMALGTATGQGPLPSYILAAYPPSPADGDNMTLSCTEEHGYNFSNAVWFRSGGEIFQTSSDRRTAIDTTVTNNNTIYRDLENRISVNTSIKQHNVTLKIKASIDTGTVWRCRNVLEDSNTITIDIVGHTDTTGTDPSTAITGLSFGSNYSTSSISNNQSVSPRSNVEELSPGFFENTKNIYIITAAAGGAVIVIVVIVVIVLRVCVRKRRNTQPTEEKINEEDNKQCSDHINTEENESVIADNVLYGGYDDDVNQTEPDKEEPTRKKSTDRPRVITDVYAQVNKVKKSRKGSQFQCNKNEKINLPNHEIAKERTRKYSFLCND